MVKKTIMDIKKFIMDKKDTFFRPRIALDKEAIAPGFGPTLGG
jgi:hypothetical protein